MYLYLSLRYCIDFNKYELTPSIRMMFCIVLVQRKLKQKISQQFPLYHIFLHLSNGPDIAAWYQKKKNTSTFNVLVLNQNLGGFLPSGLLEDKVSARKQIHVPD